jgi:hypothetical protein
VLEKCGECHPHIIIHHPLNATDLNMVARGNYGLYAMEAADEQFLKALKWRQQVLLPACLHLRDGNNDGTNW